jgi:hypothetical protein
MPVIYHGETSSNLRNELISLFVGSCCVLRAWLIRSAVGEDGFISTVTLRFFFSDLGPNTLPVGRFEGLKTYMSISEEWSCSDVGEALRARLFPLLAAT